MDKHPLRLRLFALVTGLALLAFSGWAHADPPSRVARLGYLSGPVSFSPAGENDWVQAVMNRPMTTGDRLWTDADARAEVQVGGATIRMNANTGLSVLNLDDRIIQLQLIQGVLNLRVRRLAPGQQFEIDTPNLAFLVREPGDYRITVNPDGQDTDIVVRRGHGDVYGDGAAYRIDTRQSYRFSGAGLRDYRYLEAPRRDDFDRWAAERDRAYDNSPSARYVSQDVVGYQDLDANGNWRNDPTYGNVWVPSRVASGWTPYRDGHWSWVDPWGWTWVDDAPWGYAVSHYGRWANLGGQWAWVPGPVQSRAYYAPALVAFVGGDNFQMPMSGASVGGIAWFPLAPREVYRPSYQVSRGYYENINRSNTVINRTVINNTYNITNVTNTIYANRQVSGAVVAVPRTTFVQSQPVAAVAVRVSRDVAVSAPVAAVATVAPTAKSVRGAAAAGGKPPARVFERPSVARNAPPAAHAGFAAQQQQLAAKPGKPLDESARKDLKPVAAASAPAVKLVEQAQQAPPAKVPPPPAVTQVAAPAPVMPPRAPASLPVARPDPSVARPDPSTPAQGALVAPAAPQARTPERPASAARQAEPRRAPASAAARAAPLPRQAASSAQRRSQNPRSAASQALGQRGSNEQKP
jgi:hypothetical protein